MVHLLSTPTRGGCVLIDADILLVVDRRQLPPVGQWSRVLGGDSVETLAVGSEKAQRAIIEALDHDSSLMHLTVVEAAELHEVGELGLASLCPMVDVMRVDVQRVRAAWESAAAIACVERA